VKADANKGYPAYPGAPFVGTDKPIGEFENIRPIDLVVHGVEAVGWLLLGLVVELP
jgi:hypothetical protein